MNGLYWRKRIPTLGGHLVVNLSKSGLGHAWRLGRLTVGTSSRGTKYRSLRLSKGLTKRWYR